MKVSIKQTTKHAGRAYAAGDQVTLDDTTGQYFCNCGWATRLDGPNPEAVDQPLDVKLDVQGGKHVHTAKVLGE